MKKEKKEIMKKIGSIVVAGTILLGSNSIVLAKENNYVSANNIKQSTTNKQEEIEVYYNGERIEFDQQPILVNDRTLVPFRKVFESMGCIVYYNNSESKVMALTKEGDILTHTIGTNTFDLNGEEKTFDSASTILNDRTLIPLRAVAETLSAEVEWNDKEQTVTIEKEETKLDDIEKEVINHVLDINYNPKDTKRYVEYRRQHPELSIEQVIMDVNMDLDRELELKKSPDGWYEYYQAKEEDIEDIDPKYYDSNLVLVNKFHRIDNNYMPDDLVISEITYITAFESRKEADEYYQRMKEDAKKDGVNIMLRLGYEGSITIDTIFNSSMNVSRYYLNNELLGSYFEQPSGFSELPTGLRFDMNIAYIDNIFMYIYMLENNIEIPEEFKEDYELHLSIINSTIKELEWLKANSYKYGFVERYSKDKEHITRYKHTLHRYRYVGVDVAKIMHDENLCLEEYWAKYLNPTVNNIDYEGPSQQKVYIK